MQLSVFENINQVVFIAGSNGFIGSSIIRGIFKNLWGLYSRKDFSIPNESYPNYCFEIIANYFNSDKDLLVIYAAGSGGFNLSKENSLIQESNFTLFVEKLYSILAHKEQVKLVYISSLGATCSRMDSNYSNLINANELRLKKTYGTQYPFLIVRLPSIYGKNYENCSYHGLIGKITESLLTQRPIEIYSRLDTKRNYICASDITPPSIYHYCHVSKMIISASNIVNVQSPVSLSFNEISAIIYRKLRRKLAVRISRAQLLQAEDHMPYLESLDGANILIQNSPIQWIQREYCSPIAFPQYL